MSNLYDSTGKRKVLELTQERGLNSIYQEAGHGCTSEKYSYISTPQILEYLKLSGWAAVDANQVKSRKFKGFQKHLVKLEHSKYCFEDEKINLLLLNSHNGRSSIQLKLGLFRFACANGLVTGDTFETMRLRHTNTQLEDVRLAVNFLSQEKAPQLITNIGDMKNRPLSPFEMHDFSKKAMYARFENENILFNSEDLLIPERVADRQNNLWNVFNRVQEKIINGKIEYLAPDSKVRKIRILTGIDNKLKLNSRLFDLALSYLD